MSSFARRAWVAAAALGLGAYLAIATAAVPHLCTGEISSRPWSPGDLFTAARVGCYDGSFIGYRFSDGATGEINFPPPTEWFLVPGILLIGAIAVWIFSLLVADWRGGPPRWSVGLAIFGVAAGCCALGWWGAVRTVERIMGPIGEGHPEPNALAMFALGALAILGPPVLAIILGTRAYGVFERRATDGHLRLTGAAGVGAVSLGVSVGVVAGVLVGIAILLALLMAAIAYLTVLAVIWFFLGLALLGGITVARN